LSGFGLHQAERRSRIAGPPRARRRTAWSVCVATLALLLASHARSQTPLGTAFTYQGQLSDAGAPASGSYDLEFKLFDAPSSGAQIGGTLLKANVPVAAGLFAVKLDFGAQFQGEARWLEIGVRPGGSASAFTLLSPRHEVTPTPNAVFASNAGDAATLGGVASSGYVLAGAVIMLWVAESAKKNQDLHRVENIGIYWHFVDIVWIFLFPLLYIAK
jgi:hypothetical protein